MIKQTDSLKMFYTIGFVGLSTIFLGIIFFFLSPSDKAYATNHVDYEFTVVQADGREFTRTASSFSQCESDLADALTFPRYFILDGDNNCPAGSGGHRFFLGDNIGGPVVQYAGYSSESVCEAALADLLTITRYSMVSGCTEVSSASTPTPTPTPTPGPSPVPIGGGSGGGSSSGGSAGGSDSGGSSGGSTGVITGSEDQLVPQCSNGGICGYCDLLTLAENIVNFLVYLAAFVAVIMMVYAGFLYLTAAGNTTQISKAHSVFRVTIMGLVLTLAAWLLIDLVVTSLISRDLLRDLGGSWGNLPGCSGSVR